MIQMGTEADARIGDYLAAGVVRPRLRLESWLGDTPLGEMFAQSGTVRWDGTDMCGLMDVDVQVEQMGGLSPTHPVGAYGQVLRAAWVWPDLGIEVPVGRWLISLPRPADRLWWSVQADPEGPARLRRTQWTTPPDEVVSGTATGQLGQMMAEAGVVWTPAASWAESAMADTVCAVGSTVLAGVRSVLVQAGGQMWPARRDGTVMVGRWETGDEAPAWTVDRATSMVGEVDDDQACNSVTAWYTVPAVVSGDPPTYVSHTERLMGGPRWWGGPYGRAPRVIKLDASVTAAELRSIARRELRDKQLSTASIKAVTVADPRWQVGDLWRAVSTVDGIDAICRCTALTLDVATGMATVEGAVIAGAVNGTPASYTDLALNLAL